MRMLIVVLSPLLCWYSMAAQTAFAAKKITGSQILPAINFKGKVIEAWKWNDKLGENLLIASVVDKYKNKASFPESGDDVYSAELHAFHFVKKDSVYKLLWKISDAEKNCPFDLTVSFIEGTTKITDLDNDGIAETSLQYKLACRSDASPAFMKLIMHEDSVKFALRGSMWLDTGEQNKYRVTEKSVNLETWKEYTGTEDEWEKLFGRYQTEKEFSQAPPSFLTFARRQWLLHAKESFE
jgi:hypothetical protein